MSDDSSLWQTVAVVGLISAAWSLVIAARAAMQERELDPPSQARGVLLSYASIVAFVLLLGLELKLPAAGAALAVGVAAGYFIGMQAGYLDDYGDVFARGSAWYLAPVALSLVVVIYGALDHNDSSIALGLLGGYASLGIGTGQLLFAWHTVSRVELAWDTYFDSLTFEGDAPSEAPPAMAAWTQIETCPNGHAISNDTSRFCAECGEPTRCPNGHLAGRAGLAFCNDCGAAMRG